MNKYKQYLEELKELVEVAEEERLHDCLDDDTQYVDGFLAGYREAMKHAADAFWRTM